jgi:hypothetical protein
VGFLYNFFYSAIDLNSRAHRAANPSKFPIPAESKRLYPKIEEFAAKYPTPAKVHLQVYDGCAHVLPILFAFTTPAKYCFRATASFCRFVTKMQAFSPGPPSPVALDGRVSPVRRSFFGGSFLTAPPEEIGGLPPENKRRKSWWGGERDPSLQRRGSKVDEKPEGEKRRSGKEKSNDEPSQEGKGTPKGQSYGEEGKTEEVVVKVKAKSQEVKGFGRGPTEHGGSGMVVEDVTTSEVVSEVEVVNHGSLPVDPAVGEGRTGAVRMADTDTTERTETVEVKALREANSSRSLKSSKESQGSTKSGKKRWSLIIPKRTIPERVRAPVKGLTEDVAGSRFNATREPKGERCAGDYPPVYESGFVSAIPHSCFCLS